MVSLYFHIPFCTRKCHYCHFYVIPDKPDFKSALIEGLQSEWQSKKPLLADKTIETIYFGGGTPALIGPQSIGKLIEMAGVNPGNIEITLEANPESITEETVQGFRDVGVNRLSIGVQTLDDSLLKKLGRQHTAEQAVKSVHLAHQHGFDNITIDLMYDLPGQNLLSWKETLDQAAALPISHLSLYNLTIEPHTVFYKHRETLQKELPRDEESLSMYQTAISTLENHGLKRYEISAFARDGKISKHNTGYWTARPFLGFGPSAYSYWDSSRFRNVSNLHKWHKAVTKGQDPVDYRETLEKDAQVHELFTIGIRLLKGIHLPTFIKRYGELPKELDKSIQKLISDGFLRFSSEHILLTEKGFLFYDELASSLILV